MKCNVVMFNVQLSLPSIVSRASHCCQISAAYTVPLSGLNTGRAKPSNPTETSAVRGRDTEEEEEERTRQGVSEMMDDKMFSVSKHGWKDMLLNLVSFTDSFCKKCRSFCAALL